MGVTELDTVPEAQAAELLGLCCGSSRWVKAMLARRPFGTRVGLLAAADTVWQSLDPDDRLEAFSHHPRIGEQTGTRSQTELGQRWSTHEQAGMDSAGDALRAALAEANRRYEERFGYVYVVCATGKTAEELLAMARLRLGNEPEIELATAAGELQKIMRLRLEKLLG